MPNSVANVVSAKPLATGGVFLGALGSTLPSNESTALNAALKSAGYIGEDGLTENADRSTEKVKAWGGSTVKILQTDYSLTYQFTFIEALNTEVLKAVNGADNVAFTAATSSKGNLHTIKKNGIVLPHQAFVFEVKDGNARLRGVVPDGQITEVGEITYSDDEVIAYPVTVECFEDSQGNNAYWYLDDGQKTA